ncbi:hypothetical protein H206_05360 [Candidatus Electrothrix aarhusensis]|uniref:Uncharacterized protein n=1 Tax=Candidatus Electrothrix aarhusensis TaxID=1859131 RepID=A0A444J4R9_9BACT|nr:hypothetical protein H206_05360 [Candidatus Electrothrix aarhusensis]
MRRSLSFIAPQTKIRRLREKSRRACFRAFTPAGLWAPSRRKFHPSLCSSTCLLSLFRRKSSSDPARRFVAARC